MWPTGRPSPRSRPRAARSCSRSPRSRRCVRRTGRRIAEQSLLTGMRPLLVPSLADDPTQKVLWSDRHAVRLNGGRAVVEEANGVIYLAMGLRNLGAGIALAPRVVPDARTGLRQRPARRCRRLSVASPSISTSHRVARGIGKGRSARTTTLYAPGLRGHRAAPALHDRSSLRRPTRWPTHDQPLHRPAGERRRLVLPSGTPLEPRSTRPALTLGAGSGRIRSARQWRRPTGPGAEPRSNRHGVRGS